MLTRIFFITVSIFLFHLSFSQSVLKGTVYKEGIDSLGAYVTVTNVSQGIVNLSAANGSYKIRVNEKDMVVFSYVGFLSDTIIVEKQLLIDGYDAFLLSNEGVILEKVTVRGDYRQDSLERRKYYENVYNKQTKVTGGNAPAAGVGVALSPITYFSKSGKETRELKKRLKKQEENYYIDYVFSPSWVSSITGLKDDSLRLFMYMYRPSYKFCRNNDRTALTLYVNDKLKEYSNPKKKK
ncbi:MAG: hypothetical protein IPH58_19765 [Sphingobacteriales bacterium]|nr:hypothetical protein [Sphingobacteriales bacterium]